MIPTAFTLYRRSGAHSVQHVLDRCLLHLNDIGIRSLCTPTLLHDVVGARGLHCGNRRERPALWKQALNFYPNSTPEVFCIWCRSEIFADRCSSGSAIAVVLEAEKLLNGKTDMAELNGCRHETLLIPPSAKP